MGDFRLSGQELAGNGANGLPTKQTTWDKVKAFLFQEITVELTPKQQAFENKLNDVLYQEVTFKSIRDFFFQEIKIS